LLEKENNYMVTINPTIKTQTEKRDDLVAQSGFLNRRISDLKNIISEQEAQIAINKQTNLDLENKRKNLIETELVIIKDLISKVKQHAKENL